ncbi:MAG: geranylgeranyl reductase family protein [Desulfosoma sp.]|uniref:geranylgeranyl reductase family protein n=1 Tax=Desulfosoma sp. TaxID=2603217 RepID=UPI004049B806
MIADCVVIGAGPAGSSAARRAAQHGLQVLCLEKASFPRAKPCGGALSMNGVKTLDFALPAFVQEGFAYGIRAHYASRVLEARRPQPIAVLVRREVFDAFLVEKAREAGAVVHTQEKVLGLEETPHDVKVRTTRGVYRSAYAIVAHGAEGVLNRRLSGPARLGMRWKAVTRRDAASVLRSSRRCEKPVLEFYFDAYPHGYGWVFPLRNAFSIGVGGLHSGPLSTKKAFHDFVRRLGVPHSTGYRGSTIPCCGIASVLGTPRTLYAGDAGGFGEAFSGEGIFYAMRSGQLAADTVAEAVKGSLRHPLPQVYRSRCLKVLGDNLRYAAFFARWVYWFPGFFLSLFARRPLWAQEFLGIPLGETTYKHFLLKRFSLGRLGNTGP